LEGHSVGHGIGMCQHGAAGMANSGAGFREILNHYYPNTTLVSEP
jgi:stage II sporulation protein D